MALILTLFSPLKTEIWKTQIAGFLAFPAATFTVWKTLGFSHFRFGSFTRLRRAWPFSSPAISALCLRDLSNSGCF